MDILVSHTPSSSTGLLTKFTLFPQLPSELRLKIWSHLLYEPRLIKVTSSQWNWRNPYASSGWSTTKTHVPLALHICPESRQEALKVYKLAFGSPFCPPKVYINFELDTVRFGDGPGIIPVSLSLSGTSSALSYIDPCDYKLDIFLGGGPHGANDAEKIERLVLDCHESIYDRRNFCWDEIRMFSGLKDLTLLCWEPGFVMSQLIVQYNDTMRRVKEAHPEWVVPRVRVLGMMPRAEDFGLLVEGAEFVPLV